MLRRGTPKMKNGKPVRDKQGKVIYEPYRIKVLNTINFKKSMHYNPFRYIRSDHSDWYLFRLAETYLLRAEAYYWLNQTDKAAADINSVRVRAKADPIVASQVSIEYILDERARELFAEEFRKTELTRIAFIMAEKGLNGYSLENFSEKNFWYDRTVAKNEFYKAGDILWGTNVFKISPFHVLWPIPANAIDSNQGGTINQNKGYIGYEKNIPPLTVIDDQQ